MAIRWTGADLTDFGRALREAPRPIRREVQKALNETVTPLQDAVGENARAELPSRGGLGAYVAAMKYKVQRKGAYRGRGPSLAIVGSRNSTRGKKSELKRMNAGVLRRPTYGHKPWVNQSIASGWWDKAADDVRPQFERDVQAALERAANIIADSVE